MKKLLFLLFVIGYGVAGKAQSVVDGRLDMIEILASEFKIEDENFPDNSGNAFVAIKGAQSGVDIRFIPREDESGDNTSWEYRWAIDNGVWNNGIGNDVDSSNFTFELSRGGLYKVEAFKDGATPILQTFRVFFADVDETGMVVELLDKDDCKYFKLKLNGYVPAMYKDFNGNENVEYAVNNGTWLDDVYDGIIARPATSKDTDYQIKVKDGFGFVWTSQSVVYESVIPEAKFTPKLGNTVDVIGEVGGEMGQAPLEVEFNADECVNAHTYEWFLYKDTSTMINIGTDLLDSLIDGRIRTEDYFTYIYENTGRYMVQLVAINGGVNRCKDTSEIQYVNVVESLVDVPNVFTPNGDGKNDIFMALALSVESFHGIILNRWGRKVYEWSDPAGGWDGRINGRLANPGTYYYIITARGLERTNTPKYVKKGALMLIR